MSGRTAALLIEDDARLGALVTEYLGKHEVDVTVGLSVTDQGPGIPAADRERVLAPFYRGDAARTPSADGERRRGVGLGLTLARQVAEVHSGTITIEPAEVFGGRERGCRVTLALPESPSAGEGDDLERGSKGRDGNGKGGSAKDGGVGGGE